MGCHRFGDKRIRLTVCMPNIYKYKGYLFEYYFYLGPNKLNKDLSVSKVMGKKFYDVVTEFGNLTKKQQKKYLVYS